MKIFTSTAVFCALLGLLVACVDKTMLKDESNQEQVEDGTKEDKVSDQLATAPTARALQSASQDNQPNAEDSPKVTTNATAEYRGFTVLPDLWAQNKQQGQFVFSPLSLNSALKHTRDLTSGVSQQQLDRYLRGFAVPPDLEESSLLALANRILLDQTLPLTEGAELSAAVQRVNFSESATLAGINQWVKQQTRGEIPDFLQGDLSQVRLMVLNALYFKGHWQVAFDPANTSSASFTNDDGNKSRVDMMFASDQQASYFADDEIEVLRLPFAEDTSAAGASFSYALLKGITHMPVDKLVKWLKHDSNAVKVLMDSSFTERSTDINIPVHSLASEADLVEPLRKAGVTYLFNPAGGSFATLTTEPLAVSQILQKTRLDINETGATAASATAVLATRSLNPVFSVDGSFIGMVLMHTNNKDNPAIPVVVGLVGQL